MRRTFGLLLTLGMVAAVVACGESQSAATVSTAAASAPKQYASYPTTVIDASTRYTATIETNFGSMTFALLPEEAPKAVNNFVFLARDGFFNGVISHRLIPGFMVQTGDPTGTGTGGPGYSFEIELPRRPYERGVLAMANKGVANTNGSQFFVVFADLTAQGRLDANYTVFGVMGAGEETLAKIEAVAVGVNPATQERSVPQSEIRVISISIAESSA